MIVSLLLLCLDILLDILGNKKMRAVITKDYSQHDTVNEDIDKTTRGKEELPESYVNMRYMYIAPNCTNST